MQYISPVSLLETLTPGQADKKSFALAKKKLLAELELNGGTSVTVNGREFTKNDILVYFDNLQEEDDLAYHMMIAGNPVLLRFLEHNTLELGDKFDRAELHNNPPFIEWVSPYFFHSFTSFAKECFAGRNDSGWVALSSNPVLMNKWYMEEAWNLVDEIVRDDLAAINDFLEKQGSASINFIKTITGAGYTLMLQQLPVSRFTGLRDEYAYTMMQCSIHIFNKMSKKEAAEIIGNAWRVAVSRNIMEAIQTKQAEMDQVVSGQHNAGKAGSWMNSSTGLRVIIFVVFIILKFIACNR
jgi:hypothetical protein